MTELLEQAIAKLKTLPENEQDAIASMILDELLRKAEPTDFDQTVWQAYSDSERENEEVYCRLANS
jgi:hypothetical protein